MNLSEYAEAHPVKKGSNCTVSRLPADVRGEVDEAGALITHQQISDWLLAEHGVYLSPQSVGRHRAGRCKNCG
jgi:hypothetical protein